jgi:hypothetical protein
MLFKQTQTPLKKHPGRLRPRQYEKNYGEHEAVGLGLDS